MKQPTNLAELQQQLNLDFPRDYVALASGTPAEQSDEFCSGGGKEFYLYRTDELFEAQPFNELVVPSWQLLKAFAQEMESEGATDIRRAGSSRRAKGKQLSWLASRIAIGEGNGDIIFFDQDDWSVWVLYHDGFEIEPIAMSFAHLLRREFCDGPSSLAG